MNKTEWANLPSEEKEKIRAQHRARKKRRDSYEEERRAWDRAKSYADMWGRTAKPGDWLRYPEGPNGWKALLGKIVRFKEWNDDGHNHKRAPRNKKIIVEVEPHLYDEPELFVSAKLGEFFPINEMEVLAEAARD